MQKEAVIKKEYTRPNARLVEFNYREVVMASEEPEPTYPPVPEYHDYKNVNGAMFKGESVYYIPD